MATRPSFSGIDATVETWLSDVGDAFDAIFNAPFPVPQYANEAALPSASLYEDCIAHTISEDDLWKSDGSSWIPLPKRGAAVSDASGWSDATAQTDFNALLDVLQAAHLIQ